jgi:PiT family inorganic phosphate transporter
VTRYQGELLGVSAQQLIDGLHFLSAGATCFARALNDTPKMVGLLIGAQALGPSLGLSAVAAAMGIGGVLGARRVAETLSTQIVTLNAGQGLVSNLVTAALVVSASRFGLPVSTTHVATGGLFGIGAVSGGAHWKTVGTILLAWLTTLPAAALLGALAMTLLRAVA